MCLKYEKIIEKCSFIEFTVCFGLKMANLSPLLEKTEKIDKKSFFIPMQLRLCAKNMGKNIKKRGLVVF